MWSRRRGPSAIAERTLDSDRLTALAATPAAVRPAFATLWNLDLALADVVATSSDPELGAIRLAWWRERLEELDAGAVPAEPRLRAIARQLLGRGITGKELSNLEDAWLPLLQPFPWGAAQAEGFRLRGRILFGIGARLLGGDPEDAEAAGAFWSLIDGARHCSDADSRQHLLGETQSVVLPPRIPLRLRPLTVLAAIAVSYVLDPTSGLARGMAAIHHHARGRFPSRS
jgi:phytoene synthase